MQQGNKTPTYNLKVVLHLTGIKPDTLRAWERRYGLPMPQRTVGGHRLYSQYDIEIIKWLMERQVEGMRINRAIDLFRSIEARGNDPFSTSFPIGRASDGAEQPEVAWFSLAEIRNNWVAACLSYDESKAEQILSQSFALFSVELVCLEVMLQGISDIGERWYRGDATVQQEHFASSLVVRRLYALLATSPIPTRVEKIVVGCPAQEEHVITALMATLFLRRHGWEVVFLGANVPLADLEKAIESTAAHLIIFVATQLHTAANLLTTANTLHKFGIPLAFAGSIFFRQDNLCRNIPGYYLGNRLERIVQEVEMVLKMPAVSYGTHLPRGEYQQAIIQIQSMQSMIEVDIRHELQNKGITEHSLQIASDALLQTIIAALVLDDLDSIRYEIEWVKAFLVPRTKSAPLLPEFLQVVAKSIERHTGDGAVVVCEWLRDAAHQQEMR